MERGFRYSFWIFFTLATAAGLLAGWLTEKFAGLLIFLIILFSYSFFKD